MVISKLPNNERKALINDIKELMRPQIRPQPRYESLDTHKLLDKLFVRLGIVTIIGLLGYIVFKGSNRNKQCRCD